MIKQKVRYYFCFWFLKSYWPVIIIFVHFISFFIFFWLPFAWMFFCIFLSWYWFLQLNYKSLSSMVLSLSSSNQLVLSFSENSNVEKYILLKCLLITLSRTNNYNYGNQSIFIIYQNFSSWTFRIALDHILRILVSGAL